MTTGLDGIVAAETVLSAVDGAAGRLVLRGRPLEAVAGRLTFEEVAALLWQGFEPLADAPDGLRAALGRGRTYAFATGLPLLERTDILPPTEGLRLMLAGLDEAAAPVPPAVLAVSATAVFTALIGRRRAGGDPVRPDPARGTAADILAMLSGRAPDPARARALDTYFSTVADHGLNASTFTARVVASTRAGMMDSVIAALSALKGPLHGGAPGPVLDMLDAVGRPERAEGWVADRLAAGERLMGFGHRIYRTRDPRADVLKRALDGVASPYQALADAVEAAALAQLAAKKPGRPLETNVEFYTALVLDAAGLPRALFTPAFAVGRAAGWAAHVMEQQATGRLIRPESRYVGPVAEEAA